MAGKTKAQQPPTEVLSALSDPIRWSIIVQAAGVDELAATTLERTLPVAKPTISYHVKILHDAGLISTRKAGRNCYYTLRHEVLENLADGLWELAPTPRPMIGTTKGTSRRRPRQPDQASRPGVSQQRAATGDAEEAVVLTW